MARSSIDQPDQEKKRRRLSSAACLWRLYGQQQETYGTGNVINFTCFRDRVEEMKLGMHVYTYPTQAALRK